MEEFDITESFTYCDILQVAGWMGMTLAIAFIVLILFSIHRHIKRSSIEVTWLVNRLKSVSEDQKAIPIKRKRGRPKMRKNT